MAKKGLARDFGKFEGESSCPCGLPLWDTSYIKICSAFINTERVHALAISLLYGEIGSSGGEAEVPKIVWKFHDWASWY